MSHYSRNDRVIWQKMRAIKKWAEESINPSNKQISALKGGRKSKNNSHKKSKNERQAMQASLQTTADEKATDKFLNTYGRKARVRPRPHQSVPNQYRTQ